MSRTLRQNHTAAVLHHNLLLPRALIDIVVSYIGPLCGTFEKLHAFDQNRVVKLHCLDNERVLIAWDSGEMHVFNVWTRLHEKTLKAGRFLSHPLAIAALPNGLLATTTQNFQIQIWDYMTGQALSLLKEHTCNTWSLCALGSGELASGDSNGSIHIWNPVAATLTTTLRNHIDRVICLLALPDGMLASSAEDERTYLWDVKARICVAKIAPSWNRPPLQLIQLPKNRILMCSKFGLSVWHISDVRLNYSKYQTDPIKFLGVLITGEILTKSPVGLVQAWDPETLVCTTSAYHGLTSFAHAAVMPNGNLIISHHKGEEVGLWQ